MCFFTYFTIFVFFDFIKMHSLAFIFISLRVEVLVYLMCLLFLIWNFFPCYFIHFIMDVKAKAIYFYFQVFYQKDSSFLVLLLMVLLTYGFLVNLSFENQIELFIFIFIISFIISFINVFIINYFAIFISFQLIFFIFYHYFSLNFIYYFTMKVFYSYF